MCLDLFTVKLNLAFHQFDVFFDKVQTDTGTLTHLGCRRCTEHTLEYQRLVYFGYTDAVIRHHDMNIPVNTAYAA